MKSSANHTRSYGWARLVTAFCLIGTGLVISGSPHPVSAGTNGPSFSKAFAPDTIGPNSTTTLTFTIDNTTGVAATDLAFTDALPAGMTIASPSNAATTCGPNGAVGPILSAPDGGATIGFSDSRIGAGDTCTVSVDVTAGDNDGGAAVYTNTSGQLTSSLGSSGTATDDLDVALDLPGFTKGFSPNPVDLGGRSTLTLTIDNSLNATAVEFLDFVDVLPPGMVIAAPNNASTDCGTAVLPPVLTAPPGTATITFDASGTPAFPAVAASATCTVTVDVIATAAGALGNSSGQLLAGALGAQVEAGKANATLAVISPSGLHIAKDFTDDPAAPGAPAELVLTITNVDRNSAATAVEVTDTLPAGVTIATPANASTDCGGTLTAPDAGTAIGLSAGAIAPGGTCTITVDVTAAAAGVYPNTASVVGDIGGEQVSDTGSETLYVVDAPILTKTFVDDPVEAGDTVTLRFTIEDTTTAGGSTDISFVDELTDGSGSGAPATGFLPYPVTVTLPPVPDPPCGAGSALSLVSVDTDRQGLELTGGSLTAGATCTFDVTVTIPDTLANGVYTNTTGPITATVGGATVIGAPASDDIIVIAAPALSKAFTDDPVAPGGTVTLEFTLNHDGNAATDATGIGFTDDLAAALTDLAATGLPLVDPCGSGSSLTGSVGDTLLTFAGGTLAPGDSCTFSVTLNVPAAAASGTHTNVTSGVSATVSGTSTTGPAASDDLVISPVSFTKEFIDDPIIPGGTGTLRFTITNDGDDAVTLTFFSDSLSAVLSGMAATDPPTADTCGGTPSGTTFFLYVGGSVAANSSCTIDLEITVPAAAGNGTYLNTTSGLSTSVGTVAPATDTLDVSDALLELTKEFTDDPVMPGDPATLRFTLENLDTNNPVSAIAFSDDLDAALTGLVATGLPISGCGGTADTPDGGQTIDFSGGSLAAGANCFFEVTVDVPAATTPDSYTNTTSEVDGTITGLPVIGSPASDDLVVRTIEFTKSFDGPTTASGTAVLTFTITNLDDTNPIVGLEFTDNLDGVVTGLAVTGPLPPAPCGAGSSLSGTSNLALQNGSLPASGTCTFAVTVLVPADTTVGTYPNTTSELFSFGLRAAVPATADLQIEPPPAFAKSFSPDTILQDETSTLTFTIDNTASGLGADSLDFTDTLPTGMEVASPPNASTTCTGGTLTAAAGSGTISYTGGSAPAGAACTLMVDVTGTSQGALVNTTGDLTSSSGNSGTATDTLTVTTPEADISVTKTDGRTSAVPGQDTIVYTILVANTGPSAAPAVELNDVFDPVLTCTWTSTTTGGATGNTAAGAGNVAETLAMPAGSSATYTTSCAIDPAATGTLSNTATAGFAGGGAAPDSLAEAAAPSITDPSPGNNSASDSDTELTPEVDVSVTKTDGVTAANSGVDNLDYTIVVTNSGPSHDPAVAVTDNFPTVLTCTWTSTSSGGATGNSGSGSGNISETLSMPPNSTVTYQASCSIEPTASGPITNTATANASVTDTDTANNVASDSNTTLTAQAPAPVIPATGGNAFDVLRVALLTALAGLGLILISRSARGRTAAR